MNTESLNLYNTKNSAVNAATTISNETLEVDYEFGIEGLEFLVESTYSKSQTQSNVRDENSGTFDATLVINAFLPFPPPSNPMKEYFNALQKWEGHVTQIGDEVFQARLIPITGQGDEQEAEIHVSEVTEEDRSMLKLGAVFYWSIGYLEKPSGRLRASIIRFRRLPTWTTKDIEMAENRVSVLKELLID